MSHLFQSPKPIQYLILQGCNMLSSISNQEFISFLNFKMLPETGKSGTEQVIDTGVLVTMPTTSPE